MSCNRTAIHIPQDVLLIIVSELYQSCYNAVFKHSLTKDFYMWPLKLNRTLGTSHYTDAEPTAWLQFMLGLKAMARVCRSWWIAVTPILYSNVFLHDIGQLPALIRTLEKVSVPDEGSKGSQHSLNTDYGGWVRRIQITFFIPRMWFNLYRMQLLRLLDLCSSLQSFSHKPEWDDGIALNHKATILHVLTYKVPQHISSLSELALSCVVLGQINNELLKNLSLFHGLAKLEMVLQSGHILLEPMYSYNHPSRIKNTQTTHQKIVLPTLETLVVRMSDCAGYSRLDTLTNSFSFPSLRYLTLDMFFYGVNRENLSPTQLELFLSAYGSQLLTLDFGSSDVTAFKMSLHHALSKCPKLTHIAYPYSTYFTPLTVETTSAPPRHSPASCLMHTSIQHMAISVDLHSSIASDMDDKRLLDLADRSIFPSLSSLSIIHPRKGIEPIAEIPQTHRSALEKVSTILNGKGIQFWYHGHQFSDFWLDRVDDMIIKDKCDDEIGDPDYYPEDSDSSSGSSSSSVENDFAPELIRDANMEEYSHDIFPLSDEIVERQSGELLGVFEQVCKWNNQEGEGDEILEDDF